MEKSITEAECNAMENTFHQIIANMKMSFPALEDLTGKALKLNTVLRTTISATSAFLDAFQKVANLALGSKGSTSEIGSMLIRICLRQRAIEEKLKQLAGSITEGLVTPLQERLEEWKKAVVILDKDHAKESKKAHQDIKKALSETVRLKKKSKKPKPETAKQLEHAVNDYNEKYESLEIVERNAVRSALTEEHGYFCYFVQCLKPVMDCEVAVMAEMPQVEQLMSGLLTQSLAPFSCPDKSIDIAHDVKKEKPNASLKVDGESMNGSQGSRESSVSSASSSCVPSPLHASIPGSTPHSKDIIHESHGSCDAVTTSSSNQILSSQPLASRPNCHDQARTIPRVSASSEAPSSPRLAEKPPNIDHPCDSSSDRDLVGAHQYAVPCAVGAERGDSTVTCLMTANAYAKPGVTIEQQISAQRKSFDTSDDVKTVQVVPLEGYVNMNQLACLAVQHHEMSLKKELAIDGDRGDCLDLPPPPPPPPPESPADAAIPSDTFEIATGAVRHTTSRTTEDILLSGEFEAFADLVLESSYIRSPVSNFNSLPRNTNREIASSVYAPFRYTASQRFVYGAATIRRTPKRDRSLPPIFRKSSSKAALLPAGQAIPSHDQSSFSSLRGKEYRKQMEEIYETCMAALPLPPPPVDSHRTNSAIDDDTIDDLPLPPPPEELQDVGICPQLIRKSGSSEVLSISKRQGSVVSSHASIIESLTVKFSERQTLPRESAAANFARGRRASDAMCVEDVKSRIEPVSPDGLSASIQRGIRLRRAVTNDRSAPRLPANQS